MVSSEVWRQREARAEREGAEAFATGAKCPYNSDNLRKFWERGFAKAKNGENNG